MDGSYRNRLSIYKYAAEAPSQREGRHISSGDHPASNTLNTFNPLFPKGDYFGVLATTGPGPLNFIDVHPHVELTLPHNVSASFDWIVQWRQSLDDGVYNVPGSLIRTRAYSGLMRATSGTG